jgi:hypothetical protein
VKSAPSATISSATLSSESEPKRTMHVCASTASTLPGKAEGRRASTSSADALTVARAVWRNGVAATVREPMSWRRARAVHAE